MKKVFLFLFTILAIFSFGWLYSDSNVQITSGGLGSITISGGGNGTASIVNSGLSHYPDITFYDKMDSSTTGRAPTKGAGTFTVSSNIVPAAALSSSSTASLYGNVLGFKHMVTTAAANINLSAGRAGFYFEWDTATNLTTTALGWNPSADPSPRFRFGKGTSGNTWSFKYEDVTVSQSLTAGTTYYVEFAWDHSKANGFCAEIRVDGGTFATSNTCSASVPSFTPNALSLMGDADLVSATSLNGKMDEVIISSDSTRDLYAIRNLGSYPD